MRAGEVARRAGVSVETLRYYERRRLLPEPPRGAGGHRRYDEDAVRFVRAIKDAQAIGFTLAEIEEYLRAVRRGRVPAPEALRVRMAAKIDEIVAWAELSEFIDSPIRTYSSGMSARLAFAVATDIEPDILLVDETLSVGDERFQEKCKERIGAFRKTGKTVLLVSHDLQLVRENCRRVIWIHKGRLVRDGDAESVTAAYHAWSLTGSDAPPQVSSSSI